MESIRAKPVAPHNAEAILKESRAQIKFTSEVVNYTKHAVIVQGQIGEPIRLPAQACPNDVTPGLYYFTGEPYVINNSRRQSYAKSCEYIAEDALEQGVSIHVPSIPASIHLLKHQGEVTEGFVGKSLVVSELDKNKGFSMEYYGGVGLPATIFIALGESVIVLKEVKRVFDKEDNTAISISSSVEYDGQYVQSTSNISAHKLANDRMVTIGGVMAKVFFSRIEADDEASGRNAAKIELKDKQRLEAYAVSSKERATDNDRALARVVKLIEIQRESRKTSVDLLKALPAVTGLLASIK